MMEERIYKIKSYKKHLDVIEDLLSHIEYLGAIGASRSILINIDGDGAGQIKVTNEKGEKLNTKTYNTKGEKVELEVVGSYSLV